MIRRPRRHHTPEQKVALLKRHSSTRSRFRRSATRTVVSANRLDYGPLERCFMSFGGCGADEDTFDRALWAQWGPGTMTWSSLLKPPTGTRWSSAKRASVGSSSSSGERASWKHKQLERRTG
jgi:hypothetical protein